MWARTSWTENLLCADNKLSSTLGFDTCCCCCCIGLIIIIPFHILKFVHLASSGSTSSSSVISNSFLNLVLVLLHASSLHVSHTLCYTTTNTSTNQTPYCASPSVLYHTSLLYSATTTSCTGPRTVPQDLLPCLIHIMHLHPILNCTVLYHYYQTHYLSTTFITPFTIHSRLDAKSQNPMIIRSRCSVWVISLYFGEIVFCIQNKIHN